MSTPQSPAAGEIAAPSSSALNPALPESFTGFKYEHILISVTVAHMRGIGQFDDTCARHIEMGMAGYKDVLMVQAQAQYKHCSEEQHTEGCECGLCAQVRQNQELENA